MVFCDLRLCMNPCVSRLSKCMLNQPQACLVVSLAASCIVNGLGRKMVSLYASIRVGRYMSASKHNCARHSRRKRNSSPPPEGPICEERGRQLLDFLVFVGGPAGRYNARRLSPIAALIDSMTINGAKYSSTVLTIHLLSMYEPTHQKIVHI